jgi:CheY-like chemotaxis protein
MTGTLLIIEDQESVRENIAELLELAGHRTIQAANGIEGVRKAKAHLPDLVLCDIMMPELDGYGVAEVLSRQPETAEIPFLFLTAKAEREDFRKGLAMGAVDYLTKPFESHELLETVEMRLKHRACNRGAAGGSVAWQNWVESLKSDHPATLQGSPLTPLLLPKHATLYTEGEQAKHLFFIRRGIVRLDRFDSRGKRLCIEVVGAGKFAGWSPQFSAGIHLQHATALAELEVLQIPQTDVLKSFEEQPVFALELIRQTLEAQAAFEANALSMAYGSARENTARALLRFARPSENGLEIPLSREDLANSVGMASESVIRTLAAFKKEGLTDTIKRTVILTDTDGLEDELG